MPNINYDKNGNILNLTRNGKTGATYGTIDGLSYAYTGNRLTHVDDYISGTYEADFVQRGNGNYTYWPDGSLKSDANKTISLITYNTFLKKVDQINYDDGKFIKFTYDGSGEVLKRENSIGETWEYAESFIFKNGIMYSGSSPEGRIVYNATATPQYNYEFEHRDIWGNLRVSFAAENGSLVTKQTSDFDAMGWAFNQTAGVNKSYFQYQKQERVEDFGLNIDFFKFRPSDPVLGRFWQIDPLAEQYVYNSPYALQENKFGRGVELEGKELLPWHKQATNWISNLFKGADAGTKQKYQIEPARGATVTGVRDMSGKRPIAVARVDKPHGKIATPHVNINPAVSGVPDPHTPISKTTLKTLAGAGKTLETIGKIAKPVAIATDVIRIGEAVNEDGGKIGNNTIKTTASVAGGWAGAVGGAALGSKGGAAVGTFFGPGPGTAIGGLIGGIGGGILGAFGGSWVSEKAVEKIMEK
jgi:hypothetical protein